MSLLEGYRLFTGYYIYESEMPSDTKLEFVKFLKEASADDIVDVLSGQYEGVNGLSEDEMMALHDFIEEKYGWQGLKKGAAAVGKVASAGGKKVVAGGKKAAKVASAGGKKVVAGGKAVGRGAAAGGRMAVKGGKAAYGKTFHTAMGRTALAGAGGLAAGAGGVAAYKKKK